ncbi:transcription initiation factor TFIID subunit 11 [Linderina pennispora]|nr:transcription initiation factor TFIID subunit 11 [Linderina pennispora]
MPNDLTSSTPTSGGSTPHPATPGQPGKKRARTLLTPAALLRQKRKRGGTTLSGRKPTIARSGTATPIKPKPTAPDTAAITEKLKKRTGIPDDEDTEADDDEEEMLGDDEVTLVKQSKEEVKELWDQLSAEQQQRYGVYRRTALSKSAVRRLASSVLGQQISPTLSFVIAGFSKVFVGEIIERAVAVQRERGDSGPLTPAHLREAYRQHKKETGMAANSSGFTKRLF